MGPEPDLLTVVCVDAVGNLRQCSHFSWQLVHQLYVSCTTFCIHTVHRRYVTANHSAEMVHHSQSQCTDDTSQPITVQRRYICRSQWSSGSMSDCSARGPGIESRCGQLCLSHNHCDLQPWVRAACTLPAVPRSTQPSTLRGTVNEYQLSG